MIYYYIIIVLLIQRGKNMNRRYIASLLFISYWLASVNAMEKVSPALPSGTSSNLRKVAFVSDDEYYQKSNLFLPLFEKSKEKGIEAQLVDFNSKVAADSLLIVLHRMGARFPDAFVFDDSLMQILIVPRREVSDFVRSALEWDHPTAIMAVEDETPSGKTLDSGFFERLYGEIVRVSNMPTTLNFLQLTPQSMPASLIAALKNNGINIIITDKIESNPTPILVYRARYPRMIKDEVLNMFPLKLFIVGSELGLGTLPAEQEYASIPGAIVFRENNKHERKNAENIKKFLKSLVSKLTT
jgi:hypothetical protein